MREVWVIWDTDFPHAFAERSEAQAFRREMLTKALRQGSPPADAFKILRYIASPFFHEKERTEPK